MNIKRASLAKQGRDDKLGRHLVLYSCFDEVKAMIALYLFGDGGMRLSEPKAVVIVYRMHKR